jgi:hypothetical protein
MVLSLAYMGFELLDILLDCIVELACIVGLACMVPLYRFKILIRNYFAWNFASKFYFLRKMCIKNEIKNHSKNLFGKKLENFYVKIYPKKVFRSLGQFS